MRLVKMLSVVLAVAAVTAACAVHAQEYNRFGKGPTTIGLTPPGYSGNNYSRGNVYYAPAPVVATAPASDGRRAFSAEPSVPQPAAPVATARTGRWFRRGRR